MECRFPQDVQNGMVEFSGLRVGSMARFSTFFLLRVATGWHVKQIIESSFIIHNYC